MAEQYSWLDASGKGYSAGQYGGKAGKLREWSRSTVADGRWLNKETIEPFSGRDQYLLDSLNQTYNECSAFSGDLQNQINVIEARADVIDVVGSYGDFVNKYSAGYVPGIVSDNDVVKILNDETSAHSQTYYRWHSADNPATGTWTGVGSLEPSYNNANISDGILTINNTNTERNYTLSGEKYIELNGNGKTGAFGLTDEFISSASQCYTALTSHSASWDETSAMLNENSGYWNQAYTALTSNSASWNKTSATLRDNSGKWEQSYTALTSTSGGWNNTSAWVYNNSANIVDASATLYNNSANWQATYSAVSSNSATWNETAYVPLSAIECKIGSDNNVSDIAFAQGLSNTAEYTAFAQGSTNTASMDAFSQGISNTAAQEAFTQGSGNNAEINSFAQGKANNAAHTAFAQGLENTAMGYSFAQGYKNEVNSLDEPLGMSFAQGYANTADLISFAQGRDNHADDRSFAQGSANTAIEIGFAHGVRNHAAGGFANGTDNTALGTGSLAIGINNYAGNYSQALGRGVKINGFTTAPLRGGMAIGAFNKTSANVAFVIGNGTNESNRSDLYWIDYDGNVSAKGNISATNFYINGNSIDSIVSAKFSAYNGSNTLLTAYPISSFGLYANTAKYITVSTANNNRLNFSVADTLINSASSGYQAKQWINTNGDGIIGVSSTLYNNSAAWGETAYVPLSAIECKIGNANSANEISFAQGQGASAKTISFAQGLGSVAQRYSFAQGLTNSSTVCSFTQGISNIANDYSIAQGVSSTALNYSQAFGAGSVITNTGMAIGNFNKTSAGVAFVIGNGTNALNRSDLYWIDHDGNVSAKGNISATNFYINGTLLPDLTYTMLYSQGSTLQPTKFNISSLNVTNYRSNQSIDFISLNVTASNGSNASFALWPDDTTITGTPVKNTLIPIIDTMQNRNQKKYMKVSDLNIGNYVSAATIEGVQQKITIATAHEVDDFTQEGIIYLVF